MMKVLGYNPIGNCPRNLPTDAFLPSERDTMRPTIALLSLLFAASWLVGETVTFDHITIHRHRDAEERMSAERDGILTFDDDRREVTFQTKKWGWFDEQIKFEAPYDNVTKVVFDSTTHRRGEGGWALLNLNPVGIVAAAAIGARSVQDNWLYIEYKVGERAEPVLLMLPNDCLADVKQKAAGLFGGRVVVSSFPEHSEEIPPKQLRSPQFKSKFAVKLNKKDHPLPTERPDKATIFVVCPMVGLEAGHGHVKLHANDRVIAVNELGTYSFAYLDPGKYRLMSQSSNNGSGFETELEAGKTYYFVQNSLHDGLTVLSRNSGEVVTYLAADTYLSKWNPK
jgi:hypothetical protein